MNTFWLSKVAAMESFLCTMKAFRFQFSILLCSVDISFHFISPVLFVVKKRIRNLFVHCALKLKNKFDFFIKQTPNLHSLFRLCVQPQFYHRIAIRDFPSLSGVNFFLNPLVRNNQFPEYCVSRTPMPLRVEFVQHVTGVT